MMMMMMMVVVVVVVVVILIGPVPIQLAHNRTSKLIKLPTVNRCAYLSLRLPKANVQCVHGIVN